MTQLRKCDVRKERGHWFVTITLDAGPVKTKQARKIPLHSHLIELGFLEFVEASADGYLFKAGPSKGREGVTNRVRVFVRLAVSDPDVAPNHAWRHLFKTIGIEAEIQERVLDAICGHVSKTIGGRYGEVTLTALAKAIERFPRFPVECALQDRERLNTQTAATPA